jgi:hypothetical protein
MINHYCDLTLEQKILLCEIINRVKTGDIEAELDTVGIFKQEFAEFALDKAIKELLKEGEGIEMTKSILTTITTK